MTEVFAIFCMIVLAVVGAMAAIVALQERHEKQRHDGIVQSLYEASEQVSKLDTPMSHENIQQLLSLLAKRRYVNWSLYQSDRTFGED